MGKTISKLVTPTRIQALGGTVAPLRTGPRLGQPLVLHLSQT